jgi:hypothetical protein
MRNLTVDYSNDRDDCDLNLPTRGGNAWQEVIHLLRMSEADYKLLNDLFLANRQRYPLHF